ncbi:GNAT family N-acetyltransferase [Streptomyces sp. NPDC002574]|uniref:GNAT family N-acetyltransferase n=1 Tax=Streptomyces sp. NPDC002574 TaxID=3364652 RepID=UPI0036CEA8B4
MDAISPLSAAQLLDAAPGLAALLADAVAGGASLGFLAPFGQDEALEWWRGRATAVADGRLAVWAARDAEGVTGTVSLAREEKANGRHRAEVVKLMVHRRARGRGLGRRLLEAVERAAADGGATLLLLDTETGSPAEHLYRSAGWTPYGVVPGHATDPAGVPRPTTFFFKSPGAAARGA